jgi:periplasmic divalent cation tolerance protein
MTDITIVLTTVGADERAEQLARQLVDERLAACVNVHPPMVSLYRWKGAVERDTECQIVIKTTRDRLGALEARLREIHPYELPELVVVQVDSGSTGYLNWVREQVSDGLEGQEGQEGREIPK